jgi:hypothetical protein
VGFGLPSNWDRVGHAPTGGGAIGELEMSVWEPL